MANSSEEYRRNAIMVALGHALALADPNDPDCRVGSIFDDGTDDRHIRQAVRLYVHSWIVGPLAAALGVEGRGDGLGSTREKIKAQEYLDELAKATTEDATSQVRTELFKGRPGHYGSMVFESFSFESLEVFRNHAEAWLKDRSELDESVYGAADWSEIYEDLKN